MNRRRMMLFSMAGSDGKIYAPGYEEFKNCSDWGIRTITMGDLPGLTFGAVSVNLEHKKAGFTQGTYLYIQTDFTECSTLHIEFQNTSADGDTVVGYNPELSSFSFEALESFSGFNRNTAEFDISEVTGTRYIFIGGGAYETVKIYSIWVE